MEGLSVIIPVYNSAQILPELLERLSAVLPQCASSWEVILVNDGSLDNSWDAIDKSRKIYPWIKGINLMRNYGQHNALLCGIKAASYDLIVTMDDDLQHPPEEIPKLIAKLGEGYDLVYGLAKERPFSPARNIATKIIKKTLEYSVGIKHVGILSSFRAFKTELRKAFKGYRGISPDIDILLTWATVNFAKVDVEHNERRSGVSNYSVYRVIKNILNMVFGFTAFPLRVVSLLGLIFSLFGGVVLIYVILLYFIEGSVPGFTFLASIISMFSGTQLFTLGIIGEYLARMHFRAMGTPSATIRNIIKS